MRSEMQLANPHIYGSQRTEKAARRLTHKGEENLSPVH